MTTENAEYAEKIKIESILPSYCEIRVIEGQTFLRLYLRRDSSGCLPALSKHGAHHTRINFKMEQGAMSFEGVAGASPQLKIAIIHSCKAFVLNNSLVIVELLAVAKGSQGSKIAAFPKY